MNLQDRIAQLEAKLERAKATRKAARTRAALIQAMNVEAELSRQLKHATMKEETK